MARLLLHLLLQLHIRAPSWKRHTLLFMLLLLLHPPVEGCLCPKQHTHHRLLLLLLLLPLQALLLLELQCLHGSSSCMVGVHGALGCDQAAGCFLEEFADGCQVSMPRLLILIGLDLHHVNTQQVLLLARRYAHGREGAHNQNA